MAGATEFADNRSPDFVFVPFCSLSQAFHAMGLVKYEWRGIVRPIMETLMHYDVNVIQMPCMETIFAGGTSDGLNRAPKGRKHYDTPEFRMACRQRAEDVVVQIEGILSSGYRVAAILGMEYSPSCAVRVQYPPRKGDENRGVFIDELSKQLNERDIDVPMLGINRRGIKPTIERLEALLERKTVES